MNKVFEKKVSAKQGKALRDLIDLLTKLKVNYKGKLVESVSMHRTMSCKENEYRLQVYVRGRSNDIS